MYKKIDSFEAACAELGREAILPDVSMIPEEDRKPIIANYKLDVIQKAINKILNWSADYSDGNQRKYFPWFEWSASSRRFAYHDYAFGSAGTVVGSRRVFPSSEVAIYFGEQFIDIHNDVLVIEKSN